MTRTDRAICIAAALLALAVGAVIVLTMPGCGESAQRADLPPATLGIPIGHTPSSRTYAAWCGPTCRCNVTVNQDCAEDAVWLAEGTPPMPAAPFQPVGSVTPVECKK